MSDTTFNSRPSVARCLGAWSRSLLFRLFASTLFLGSCGAMTIGSQTFGGRSESEPAQVTEPGTLPDAPPEGAPGATPETLSTTPAPSMSAPGFVPTAPGIPGIGSSAQPTFGTQTGPADGAGPGGVGAVFPGVGTAVLGDSGYRSPVYFGSEPVLRVGVLLPLSGPHASLGNNLLQAARQAQSDYAKVPMQLIPADSGGTPGQTQQALEMLAAKGVHVVVGPLFQGPTQQAAAFSSQQRLPLIALNPGQAIFAANGNNFPYAYLNAFHQDPQARFMARFAIDNKRDRVAILAPDHEGSQQIINVFTREFESLGGQVVKIVLFPKNTSDFSDVFKELGYRKNEEITTSSTPFDQVEKWAGFNALFIPAPAKTVRLIAPQAAFFSLLMPEVILLGTSLWDTDTLLAAGPAYLMDAVYSDIDPTDWEKFAKSYEKRWKTRPEKLAVLSYDGVAAVAQLFQEQRSGRGHTEQGSLLRRQGFKGIGSTVRFLSNGLTHREYSLLQVTHRGAQRFKADNWEANLKYKRYWWTDTEDDDKTGRK